MTFPGVTLKLARVPLLHLTALPPSLLGDLWASKNTRQRDRPPSKWNVFTDQRIPEFRLYFKSRRERRPCTQHRATRESYLGFRPRPRRDKSYSPGLLDFGSHSQCAAIGLSLAVGQSPCARTLHWSMGQSCDESAAESKKLVDRRG